MCSLVHAGPRKNRSMQLTRIILLIIGIVNLVRGGGHFLLPDGGAAAANMSLTHSGAADLVYVFGVSGAFEVLLALWMIGIAVRMPALVAPAFWTQIAKSGLVLLLGYALKPPVGVPPGLLPDVGTLVLAVIGLGLTVLMPRSGGEAHT